jgi:hypothetical protein
MKNIILSIALFALPFIAFSQMEKGSMMAGANYYFGLDPELQTLDNDRMVTYFRLDYAYFISNNITVGGTLVSSYKNFTALPVFGFGPMARFYFFNNWVRPFIEPRSGLFIVDSVPHANVGATIGSSFLVSKNIALEVGINDDFFVAFFDITNVLGLSAGLQVHFRK